MASVELGNTEEQWEGQTENVTVPHVQYEWVWNPVFCHLEVVENSTLHSRERPVEFSNSRQNLYEPRQG